MRRQVNVEPHGALTLALHQDWDNACRKVNRIAYRNEPGLLEAFSERDRAWARYAEAREVELRDARSRPTPTTEPAHDAP